MLISFTLNPCKTKFSKCVCVSVWGNFRNTFFVKKNVQMRKCEIYRIHQEHSGGGH